MANITCPTADYLPELSGLPIPKDIDYVITPGRNPNSTAMVACCSPNAVNLVNNCYLWCTVPDTYTNKDTVTEDFGTCLRQNGMNATIIAENTSGSSARTPTLTGLAIVALAFSFFASI